MKIDFVSKISLGLFSALLFICFLINRITIAVSVSSFYLFSSILILSFVFLPLFLRNLLTFSIIVLNTISIFINLYFQYNIIEYFALIYSIIVFFIYLHNCCNISKIEFFSLFYSIVAINLIAVTQKINATTIVMLYQIAIIFYTSIIFINKKKFKGITYACIHILSSNLIALAFFFKKDLDIENYKLLLFACSVLSLGLFPFLNITIGIIASASKIGKIILQIFIFPLILVLLKYEITLYTPLTYFGIATLAIIVLSIFQENNINKLVIYNNIGQTCLILINLANITPFYIISYLISSTSLLLLTLTITQVTNRYSLKEIANYNFSKHKIIFLCIALISISITHLPLSNNFFELNITLQNTQNSYLKLLLILLPIILFCGICLRIIISITRNNKDYKCVQLLNINKLSIIILSLLNFYYYFLPRYNLQKVNTLCSLFTVSLL